MAVTNVPQFGSFDFEAADVTVEEWRDDPEYGNPVVTVPGSDRGRELTAYLRPRRVGVKGIFGPDGGGTLDQLRTIEDALRYALRPGYRNLYRNPDRYLRATVTRLSSTYEGFSWGRWEAEFTAADPYWYAETADSDTWAAPTNGATHGITNSGGAVARPSYTFTMGSSATLALTLANSTTGDSFSITGLAVTSGQVLVVDSLAQTVTLAGANKLSTFTGQFFGLEVGANTLALTLSGPSLTSLGTGYRKRWL